MQEYFLVHFPLELMLKAECILESGEVAHIGDREAHIGYGEVPIGDGEIHIGHGMEDIWLLIHDRVLLFCRDTAFLFLYALLMT